MFSNLGFGEILILLLIFVLLFGAKKIPELAQGIGKGMKEFKKALREDDPDKKDNNQINGNKN